MSKLLPCLPFGLFLVAGCQSPFSSQPPPIDLGTNDLTQGGAQDMASSDANMMTMYTAMSPHDIDTAPGTIKNKAVKLVGVVVTTPVSTFLSQKTQCVYEVTVQDPACTTPPCGIVVDLNGPTVASGKTASDCPFAKDTTTAFKATSVGDVLDVTGTVDTFADSKPNGTPAVVEHSIKADSVTKTGGPMTITPMVPADITQFVTHVPGDWNKYEGTLVTIKPSAGKLTLSSIDTMSPYHFHTMPGNVDWATTFHGIYKSIGDGGTADVPFDGGTNYFPQQGLLFSSITGVVYTIFGGQVTPRFMDDFKP
jgi:hypothetical protein